MIPLIVFAKAPIPGYVKTRMVPALGKEGAARLQERLVTNILTTALQSHLTPLELWCAPNRSHPFFSFCQHTFQVTLRDQQGEDLGARMAHAFQNALEQHEAALLCGSDCPDLTVRHLHEAAAAQRDNDVVLIPAEDGGYVLIGMRKFHAVLFQGIPWGTDAVLEKTRAQLRQLGLSWHEMASLRDLDRPADLEHWNR